MALAPELEQFIGKRAARRTVVEAIVSSSHAFSADGLSKAIRVVAPRISRATIYRTIRNLRERGLLREIVTKGGVRLYQLASDSRCFLWICDDCGLVRSESSPPIKSALMDVGCNMGLSPWQLTAEVHFQCAFFRREGSCPQNRLP